MIFSRLIWFLRVAVMYWPRPALWPELWRMAFRYVTGLRFVSGGRARAHRRQAEENAAALAWCAGRAVSDEGLARCLPFPFVLTGIGEQHPQESRQAASRAADCPVNLGGAGNIDLLYSLSKAIGARSIVETGVALGWSSLAFLLSVRGLPVTGEEGARVYSTNLPHPFSVPPEVTSGSGWIRTLGLGV